MSFRILVIDDEESIRLSFQLILVKEGYEVVCAESYADAVAIVSRQAFHLIFADIILGGQLGTDLLREFKSMGLRCPVVMITGQPDLESAAEAVRQGAYDYLPKPIRKETLLRISRIALEHKRLQDEKERIELEKERYQQHLEAVFRSLKEGIITVDRELRVTDVNAAASAFFGVKACEMVGSLLPEAKGQGFQPVAKLLQEAMTKGIEVRDRRLEFRSAEGRPKVGILSSTPLVDRSQHSIGAVLTIRDHTRLEQLERELVERHRFHRIIGKSAAMQGVFRLIETLAETDTTVLITGESGTGKELVAKALHYEGRRARRSFIPTNCSALAETLLESELFGHVKGAFTGAWSDKKGYFEAADGGTIFLDEIGDISPLLQVKLLRVLQEREIERVGDSKRLKVNVRVIAATHRDLKEKVQRGEFREDLFYRLKVVEIKLPPLRARAEDIPPLLDHFRILLNKTFQKGIQGVDDEVLELFMTYPWPGNVRELQHALEHAFVMCRNGLILPCHLPSEIRDHPRVLRTARQEPMVGEQHALLKALEKSGGNKAKAARFLGMSRQTLYRKLKERETGLLDGTS